MIPVVDEEAGIRLVIEEAVNAGIDPSRILVVDGGSRDNTPRVAAELGARVLRQRGSGKGEAIIEAIHHILSGGLEPGRVLVAVVDGDASYPASEAPRLAEALIRMDASEAIGERRYGRENIPLLNRIGNRILTHIFNMIHATRLMDVLSGLYVIRLGDYYSRSGLLINASGFDVEVEIAGLAASRRGVIGVPIQYRERMGQSKLSQSYLSRLKAFIRILLNIFRTGWRLRRRRLVAFMFSYPLLFFSIILLCIYPAYTPYLLLAIVFSILSTLALYLARR